MTQYIDGKLMGVVTFDDVLDAAEEEATEDFQRIGGMEPMTVDYARAGVGLLWRKRIGWLLLLVADFLSSSVIAHWANIIGSVLPVILTRFKLDPAVISSPFITTAADVTGLVIYFNIARWVLGV